MNFETKSFKKIEPKSAPQALAGEGDGIAKTARSGKELPDVRRRQARFRPMFIITGAALCMGLSSCVEPYGPSVQGYTASYRPGYRVNTLPSGYRSEIISGKNYYYHKGHYYLQNAGNYMVVDPPRSSRYYREYDRRHQVSRADPRLIPQTYDRNDPRYDRGDMITRLPANHRVVNKRGNTYYQVGNRYYRRQNDIFVVVSRPR